ncbi:ARM repeat-containing protein [Rhizopus microsporus ATCC 52813]|uniref:ARM repeat-containing protein n=1 Tax=Rhizopus microsporus ATCC 52813 TaxID=1340429 RepID=A0A2G4T4L7_RHIZD|nr:ARM repeat-containing protein [Rhizopus microsporus ATCC 52813]PHZ15957.1 ARM repeat-containing protein [Rhizopus microsporus ATCC 52813]
MNEEVFNEEEKCIYQKSHFEDKEDFMANLEIIIQNKASTQDCSKALVRLGDVLDLYQEQPHLLDPFLESFIQPVMQTLRENIDSWLQENGANKGVPEDTIRLFRFLYLLTKTRGYKTIVKFMPHEVTDLEPVFEFLCKQDITGSSWELRYICFIWLSLICMIPFDLKRIDSASQSQDSLVIKMLDLCKRYIKSTGKERDGASFLIARLLSRQDLCDDHLIPFIEWAKDKLTNTTDVFEVAGILQSLCIVYQLSPRQTLLPTLDEHVMPLLTMPIFDTYANNSLIRKLRTKLTQRVGLAYLRPKVAAWRYQRGNRSLKHNLEGLTSTVVANQQIKHKEDDDGEEEVSENLEIIIEILLNGLRDKDTIVRWSAAKGIGRITQRLPRELAEDVISSLLELFKENTFIKKSTNTLDLSAVSDSTWHGVSLAVAELARRGLLLPKRLKEVIPWGLKFDIKKGSHSIGAHVRDACCYVFWAFARAYAPEIIKPFVQEIAQNLVVVSVFDREINVRRASSAAFQENVGRQGIFPHGIDIIQVADYFSVGNRNNAFLNIAAEIAKFEEYRYHLIDHLINITSKHWDKAMRVLASKALYNLAPLDPIYFMNSCLQSLIPSCTSTDMQISHGALLAIAEISLSLWQTNDPKVQKLFHQQAPLLVPILSNLPFRSLTTFGSEHIREAACHLISCLSATGIAFDNYLPDVKKIIWSSLERKEENVQEFAVVAFGAVAKAFGIQGQEIEEALIKIEMTNPMYYARRGFTLALGTLDYEQYHEWLHDVLMQLCKASQVQQDHQANDAEAKRNAILGLTQILRSLNDHLKQGNTDQRGDVGSWVRVATMNLLRFLMPCISKLDTKGESSYLDMQTTTRFVAALLKQSVERIDKVRACAGQALYDLISDEDMNISSKESLKKYIYSGLNWSAPSDIYPTMVQLLSISEYRFELLTGLITSAGGLTESLVRHSSTCLIEYMDSLPIEGSVDCSLTSLFETLVDIFIKYLRQERVTLPLLDVLGLLYESGTLLNVADEKLHLKLFLQTKKETFKSKNIRKILSSIKVYTGLASLDIVGIRVKALQQLLAYLVHSFPRVRIEASDQLYTLLSVAEEDYTEAMDIITGTDWAQPLDIIKTERDKLYTLLDIPKPVLVKK